MSSKLRKIIKFLPQFFTILGAVSVAFAMLFSMVNLPVNAAVAEGGTIYWGGNGATNLPCPYGALWILAPGSEITSAILTVKGMNYPMELGGSNWKAESIGALPENLAYSDAYVTYMGVLSNGTKLTISHCIDGNPTPPPDDTPTDVPPTDVPPTDVPPTDVPPTDVPPTDVPPTDVPPTDVPPTDVPPTDVPPTDVPPTDVPPTDVPPTDVPPTDVPPTDVPPTDVPPTDVPPTDVPPTDVPPTDVPPTDVPPTDVPPTDVPPTDVPPTDVPPTGTPDPGSPTPDPSETPDPGDPTPNPSITPDPGNPTPTEDPGQPNNPTSVPTMSQPVPSNDPTILIPVTGMEIENHSPLGKVQSVLFNLGLGFLGIGLVLQSLRKKLNF